MKAQISCKGRNIKEGAMEIILDVEAGKLIAGELPDKWEVIGMIKVLLNWPDLSALVRIDVGYPPDTFLAVENGQVTVLDRMKVKSGLQRAYLQRDLDKVRSRTKGENNE